MQEWLEYGRVLEAHSYKRDFEIPEKGIIS